jgi:hypothetical protein
MGRGGVQEMMPVNRRLALVAAFCLLAVPARAMPLEPGEWQGTETGTENGEAAKPETTTGCVTSADTKDLVKTLSSLKEIAGNKCKAVQLQDNGSKLTFKLECGASDVLSIVVDTTINFDNSRHYSGTVKSTVRIAGKATSSDKQFDSKWIGPCTKQ